MLGNTRAWPRIGIQPATPQHDDARSKMIREILVSRSDDHGISRVAATTDPSRHVATTVDAESDVEQMKDGIVARSRMKQVGLRAMIDDSPRGGRTFSFTEPAHFPGVVAQQTGGAQQKRRLPCSTRADEREGFSRRDREADSAQNVDRCEASAGTGGKSFGESAELEGDNHEDRYTIALYAATSRRNAHHRKLATAVAPAREFRSHLHLTRFYCDRVVRRR
jgi:hypothetical protein